MSLTGILTGASAATGILGTILGNEESSGRQRAIQRAHENYGSQRQAIFDTLANDVNELAQENHAARLAFQEAMASQERVDQAQERQAQVMSAIAAAMPQEQAPQGRTGQQKRSGEAQQAQTAEQQGFLNAIFGAQAAQQGRSMFDTQQQGQLSGELRENVATSNDLASLASSQDLQNQIALQSELNRIGAQQPGMLPQLLNLTSGLTGTGAMISQAVQSTPPAAQYAPGATNVPLPDYNANAYNTWLFNMLNGRGSF